MSQTVVLGRCIRALRGNPSLLLFFRGILTLQISLMLKSDTLVILARSGRVKELPVFSFGVADTPQAASHVRPNESWC
jgi:hypothetical protein